jgi:hypothetical protein
MDQVIYLPCFPCLLAKVRMFGGRIDPYVRVCTPDKF